MNYTYDVELPIAGSILVQVTIDDKSSDAALAAAWARYAEEGSDAYEEVLWEAYDALSEGNVLYAPLNRATADLKSEEE